MTQAISKSKLKPKILEYLRNVEKKNVSYVVTHFGKPVAKIVPHTDESVDEEFLLRDSVVKYKKPTEPTATKDWEATK